MKEVKNWRAILIEEGKIVTAIPLPGCIIEGEFEDEEKKFLTLDVDLSALTFTTPNYQKYRLSGARQDYLTTLNQFIEIGKSKDITIPDINIETLGIEKSEGYER